jgi:hypothetical protein
MGEMREAHPASHRGMTSQFDEKENCFERAPLHGLLKNELL